jgi:hypothetical protein
MGDSVQSPVKMFQTAALLFLQLPREIVLCYFNVPTGFLVHQTSSRQNFWDVMHMFVYQTIRCFPLPDKLLLLNFPQHDFDAFEHVMHNLHGFHTEVEWMANPSIEEKASEIVASLIECNPEFYLSVLGQKVGLYNTCGGESAPGTQLWGRTFSERNFYVSDLACPTVVNKFTEIATILKTHVFFYQPENSFVFLGHSPDTFFGLPDISDESDD